jgi:hypothetical protein
MRIGLGRAKSSRAGAISAPGTQGDGNPLTGQAVWVATAIASDTSMTIAGSPSAELFE